MSKDIAIIGGGIAGSYLGYLMKDMDLDIEIFEKNKKSNIGEECAWGLRIDELSKFNLPNDVDHYVLSDDSLNQIKVEIPKVDYYTICDLKNVRTINKPLLIKDFHDKIEESGITINYNENIKSHQEDKLLNFSMIIDATGHSRRILNNRSKDKLTPCYQLLASKKSGFKWKVVWTGHGYLWEFPLGGDMGFIGCGDNNRNPKKIVEEYISDMDIKIVKREGSVVRTFPPQLMCKFEHGFSDPILGVGESIGCVSPISGEGIIPSMESVEVLFHTIDWKSYMEDEMYLISEAFEKDCLKYSKGIDGLFKKYIHEYRFINAIAEGKILSGLYHALFIGERKNLKATFSQKMGIISALIRERKSE